MLVAVILQIIITVESELVNNFVILEDAFPTHFGRCMGKALLTRPLIPSGSYALVLGNRK